MFDTQFMHLVLRLLLTAFLGGIIGLERSAGDRPAGLRDPCAGGNGVSPFDDCFHLWH